MKNFLILVLLLSVSFVFAEEIQIDERPDVKAERPDAVDNLNREVKDDPANSNEHLQIIQRWIMPEKTISVPVEITPPQKIQSSREVKTRYQIGLVAFENEDWSKAINSLELVIDKLKNEDRVNAMRKLAHAHIHFLEQTNKSRYDIEACKNCMERALQMTDELDKEDYKEFKATLARCLEMLGQTSKSANMYLDLSREFPDNPDFFLHAAECFTRCKDFKMAKDVLSQLVSIHNDFIPGWIAFAQYCLESDQDDLALEQLNNMVKENENAQAYAQRAIFLYTHPEMDQMDLAEESAVTALQKDPNCVDALIAGIRMYVYRKEYNKAHEYLDKARNIIADVPDKTLNQYLVTFSIELSDAEGKPESALDLLQRDVQEDPMDVLKHLQLFQRLIVLDKIEEAQKEINNLKQVLPNAPKEYLGFFEAMIDIRQEKWAVALKKLELARPYMDQQPEMLAYIDRQRALCYGRLGQVDKQFDAFEKAVSNANKEQLVPFYIAYFQALHSAGRIQQMEEVLTKLRYQIGPDSFMEYHELRTLYFALLQQKEALKPANEQNWKALNEEMQKYNVDMNNQEGILLSVRMMVKQGKVHEAKDLLRRASVEYPNTPAFISYLALLEAQEKNFKEALSILDTEYAARKDATGLLVTKVRILSQMKSSDKEAQEEVEKQLRDIEKIAFQLSDSEKIQLLKQLAMAWLQFENLEEADRLYTTILQFEPDNVGIKVQLFDMARKSDNKQKMNAQMQRLKKELGPSSPEYRYCLATKNVWEYSKKPDNPEKLTLAKEQLNIAGQLRPTWVNIPRAQAEIAILEKDYDKAIEYLYRVDEIGTITTQQLDLLIRLLYMKNRDADVKALIQRKREANLASDAAMMSVEALANSGDGDEAVRRGSEIIDPNNPKDYLWIGHIALRAKDYRKAEDAFQHVTEIAPENPNGWLSLLQVRMIMKMDVNREEFINKIRASVPESKLPLCLAKAYQLFGDAKEAEPAFQQAVALEPNNLEVLFSISQFYMCTTHPELAIPYLQKMSNLITADNRLNADTKNQQLAWTRRSLAQVYCGMGNYDLQTQGLLFIEENLSRQPDSLEDMKVKALLLAARHTPEDNQRAIEIFDTISNLSNRELFTLAKLYFIQSFNPDTLSMRVKWQSVMNDLVSSNENNVEFLTEFIEMLFAQNAAADTVASYVEQLETVFGATHPQALSYRLRLLLLEGKNPRDIQEWLEERLPKNINDKNVEYFQKIAITLEKADQLEAAESIWKKLMGAKFEYVSQFLLYLSRQEGFSKAFAYLQENKEKISPNEQLNLIYFACRHSKTTVTKKEFKQINEYVKALFRDNPDALEVQMFQAQILELQEKYDSAIAIYNKLLEQPFTTAQIAYIENALAYLLALTGKDGARAVTLIDDAAKKFPNDINLRDSRAVVYMHAKERNKTDQAMTDLKTVVASDNSGMYQFHLAKLYLNRSNPNAAKVAFEEAKRLDPFLFQNITKLEVPIYTELSNMK